MPATAAIDRNAAPAAAGPLRAKRAVTRLIPPIVRQCGQWSPGRPRTYDPRMRILHLEAGRHLYGGAAQVRYLIDGLTAARVDNVLVCPVGGALAEEPPAAQSMPTALDGDLDLGMLPRLVRAIRATQPDVVHV